MSGFDLHDLPPPPPAYSEEDFDKKVSTAVELSLNTPQPQHDEAWETWDDNAFKAAAQALPPSKLYPPIEKQIPTLPAQGGSSHLNPTAVPYQPILPLKINKRTVDPNSSKPPPGWLENQESINPRREPSASRDVATLRYSSRQLPTHPDDLSVHPPPPAFTPEGPSLDGPPYEQVVRSSWPGVRSRGPSPHHRLPRLTQTQQHTTQRHYSQYPSHRLTVPTSISTFDPSIAYHQESNIITQQPVQEPEEKEEEHVPDAACLYNSAVASHLSTTPRHAQSHRGGCQQLMSYQPAREIFPNQLTPVRGGQGSPLSPMTPAQNPAAQRFSTYSLYHHAAMTGLRNERHVASLHYRPGDG